MFKRILVPVDFSEKASSAVDVGCRLATPSHGEVILLHVIETIENVEFDELRTFYNNLEKNAASKLRQLANQALKGTSVQTETVYGKRSKSIIEFATKRHVDLIVLNSHRVQPGSAFPSISYEVGVLAPCPVLLLK